MFNCRWPMTVLCYFRGIQEFYCIHLTEHVICCSSGIPESVPLYTTCRMCSSGLQAVVNIARKSASHLLVIHGLS